MNRSIRRTYLALIAFVLMVSCKTVTSPNFTSNDDSFQVRATEIHEFVKSKLENAYSPELRSSATWYAGASNFQPDWIVQSPEGYWGRAGRDLPKNLGCKAGEANCDEQFLRHTCNVDADCAAFNTSCRDLISSVTAPGQVPRKMCLGSGDSSLDRYYSIMVSAEKQLEVTSLTLHTDRYYEMLVNALAYLSHKEKVPSIRLLFSGAGPLLPNILNPPEKWLTPIFESIKKRGGNVEKLRLDFAWLSTRKQPLWNHSKIILADQSRVLTGGHNPWDADYLRDTPIFDLSLETSGDIGKGVKKYIDGLWDAVRVEIFTDKPLKLGSVAAIRDGRVVYVDPEQRIQHAALSTTVQGSSRVIGLGRLGFTPNMKNTSVNASDDGIRFLIDAAKSSLYIAQQDIFQGLDLATFGIKVSLLPTLLPSWAMDSLINATVRGVKIKVAKSDDTDPMGYGMAGPEKSLEMMIDALVAGAKNRRFTPPNGQSIRAYMCDHFELAPWRFKSGENKWANGDKIGAHPKLIVVDESSFYMGSQNIYPSNLEEFGLVVSDARVTKSLLDSYWTPLWTNSSPSKVPCN